MVEFLIVSDSIITSYIHDSLNNEIEKKIHIWYHCYEQNKMYIVFIEKVKSKDKISQKLVSKIPFILYRKLYIKLARQDVKHLWGLKTKYKLL